MNGLQTIKTWVHIRPKTTTQQQQKRINMERKGSGTQRRMVSWMSRCDVESVAVCLI